MVLRWAGTWFCLVAVLMAGGGFWPLLQAVAWGRMLVVYAQANPVSDAVRMTFDGQHPCPMCREVARGQREESQKPVLLRFAFSAELCPPGPPPELPERSPLARELPRPSDLAAVLRTYPPPSPPPRISGRA